VGAADVARYASTPLLDSDVPSLVPLETLVGRDNYAFSEREQPPWRGQVQTSYPELPSG